MPKPTSSIVETASKILASSSYSSSLKQNIFSSSSIFINKEFCGLTFINSTSSDLFATNLTNYYTLTYTLRVCDFWDDLGFNNTQILDEVNTIAPNLTNVSIVNITLIPTDEYTKDASCISVVAIPGVSIPTFTLLASNCSAGNSLTCNSTYLNGVTEQVHPGARDLPPINLCHTEPTCCLRYTLSVTIQVVYTNFSYCPAIQVNNCAFANASLCSCSFSTIAELDYKNNKFLGKKYSDLSENDAFTFNQQLSKEMATQCRNAPPVCAQACSNQTIPAPFSSNYTVAPLMYCELVTSNLCLCNQGNQSTNCSYSAVQCFFDYNNNGQTGVVIKYDIIINDTIDLGSSPSNIILSSNCYQTTEGNVTSFICNIPSFSTAKIVTQFCYQRYDTTYMVYDTQTLSFTDFCLGKFEYTNTTTIITIPTQSINIEFGKYAIPGTGFVFPDQNYPLYYNDSNLCETYVIPIKIIDGCVNCNNIILTDDFSQLTNLGGVISNINIPYPFNCTFIGSTVTCTCNGSIISGTTYNFNYTICFCNSNICTGTPGRIIPVNNTVTVNYLTATVSDTLTSLIICPTYKTCTGCINGIPNIPIIVSNNTNGTCLTLSTVGSSSFSNIPSGTTCYLTNPSVNGPTIFAEWVYSANSNGNINNAGTWYVLDSDSIYVGDITGAVLVSVSGNYTISCCAPRVSSVNCSITGIIQANCITDHVRSNATWDCSNAIPPCPLVPLPPLPTPCANLTTGVQIISSSLSTCCNNSCSNVNFLTKKQETIIEYKVATGHEKIKISSTKEFHKISPFKDLPYNIIPYDKIVKSAPYCNINNGVTGQQVTYYIKNTGTGTENITVTFNATTFGGTGVELYPNNLNTNLTTPGWVCNLPASPPFGISTCTMTGVATQEIIIISIDYAFTHTTSAPVNLKFMITAIGSIPGVSSNLDQNDQLYTCDNEGKCIYPSE